MFYLIRRSSPTIFSFLSVWLMFGIAVSHIVYRPDKFLLISSLLFVMTVDSGNPVNFCYRSVTVFDCWYKIAYICSKSKFVCFLFSLKLTSFKYICYLYKLKLVISRASSKIIRIRYIILSEMQIAISSCFQVPHKIIFIRE